MGASQFLARLRQKSSILLRRLWNGKLWHYGLRWQSEAATPLWIRRLTCHRSRILPSHDAAKAVSPLRSATAVHITRPLSIESEMPGWRCADEFCTAYCKGEFSSQSGVGSIRRAGRRRIRAGAVVDPQDKRRI